MSDIFESIAHGREIAKAKETAPTDRDIPLETITSYIFETDLDTIAKESEEQLARRFELESKKAEILGVVNHTFIIEAFRHIEKTVGNSFSFDDTADQLTAEQWLTHYQNTTFTPYAAWIVGEQPKKLKSKLVYDYLVRSPKETLKIITTKEPIKPTDPFPDRQDVERSYDPKTGTFTAVSFVPNPTFPKFLPHSYSTGEHVHAVSDNQMKDFGVATNLMDVLQGYNALDNSDPLVEQYKNAREWSVALASLDIEQQRTLVEGYLENEEQSAYAQTLQTHLNLQPKQAPVKKSFDDLAWGL